jgi:hypothetical protein
MKFYLNLMIMYMTYVIHCETIVQNKRPHVQQHNNHAQNTFYTDNIHRTHFIQITYTTNTHYNNTHEKETHTEKK